MSATPRAIKIPRITTAPTIPPEEHPVLVAQREVEIREDEDKDKQIVDAKRLSTR
jgi:hypothetical protein